MYKCIRRTQGGKGNEGLFIERDPKVCAAGKPTEQATNHVSDHLKHYLLQEEVDALVRDAIIPAPKQPTPRSPKQLDMRNAGIFTEARELINPPMKTKFQGLVEDFKNSTYTSYWKNQVGKMPDQVPMLPIGFNIQNTTLGKNTEFCGGLYDLVMPKDHVLGYSSPSKLPGYQTDRNYCRPAYDPNNIFGIKSCPDKRGIYTKCCLNDDRVQMGTSGYTPLCVLKVETDKRSHAHLSAPKAPNDNISCVPPGFAFGQLKPPDNLPECLTNCELNTGRHFFLKCLGHLNTLRKCLSKRFDRSFYTHFYLQLKYLDKTKTGWHPKQVVYDFCAAKYVRFNPSLIEPLLETWNAFDGSQIEYQIFVNVINHTEPSPGLPKIVDVAAECIEFSTTYNDMVKPGQEADTRLMAGIPSGRYIDKDYPMTPAGYCKAHRICLPEESDAKSCINPSTLTILGISHRDMYAQRSPGLIRKVFEAAGVKFTDETFNEMWDEAKKYHSQGLVSYETFKRTFHKIYYDNVNN